MEKATLYALEKLYFPKIQRYKIYENVRSQKIPLFYALKKLAFAGIQR
jgi:hypothetical protein